MSKRDDLGNEAGGEKGALGAFLGMLIVGVGKALVDNHNKNNLKDQINDKSYQIDNINQQISNEQQKGFFFRDNSKINSLNQSKNKILNERNDLVNKYNDKYKK